MQKKLANKKKSAKIKTTVLKMLPVSRLVILKRNPQYLTIKQMDNLKRSIKRDGFVAPILVRKMKDGYYEVVSGNHRFMAAQELNIKTIPCVIGKMSENTVKRLAINLNTIHGQPNPELLAPFLAEMKDNVLRDIHLEDDLLGKLIEFDIQLESRLSKLEPPDKMNRDSPQSSLKTCKCPKCGRKHFADE